MADENRTYQAAIEIDTTGADKKIDVLKKDIKDLKKQTDKASDSAKDLALAAKEGGNQNNQFVKMGNAIQEVYNGMHDTVDAFEEYVHDVSNQSDKVDNSFASTGKQIKKLEQEYQEMMNAIDMAMARSVDMPGASSGTLQELENLRTKVQFIYRDIVDLYNGTLTQLNNIPRAENGISAIEEIEQKAEEAAESVADAGRESAEGLEPVAKEADTIKDAYRDAGQNVTQDFDSMEQSAEQAGDTFSDVCDEVETESKGMNFSRIGDAIAGAFERVRSITDNFLDHLKMDETDPTQEMAEDVDQFGQSLEDATQQVGRFKDAWNQTTWPTEEMAAEASELEKHIDDINAEMERLKTQETPTQEFTDLQNQIEKTEKQLEKYYDRQEKYESTGVKQNSKTWLNLQYDIATTENRLSHMQTAMDNLKESGHDVEINPDTKALDRLQKDLDKSTQQLQKMQTETDKVSKSAEYIGNTLSQSVGNGANEAISKLSPLDTVVVKIRTQTQKMADPLRAYASEASQARAYIRELKDELTEVQSHKAPTEEFRNLTDEIQKTKRALDGVYNQINGNGLVDVTKMSKKQISDLTEKAEKLEETYKELTEKQQELMDSGEAYTLDVDWESITQLRKELQSAKEDYKELKKEANNAAKATDAVGRVSGSVSSGVGGMVSSVIGLLSPIAGAITSIGSVILTGLGNILKSALSMAGNILQAILKLVVNVASLIWNALKKAVSVSFDVATNIAKMVSKPIISGVKSLAKWIAKAGLSLSGFNIEAFNGEGLIKKLTNAVDEFMGFFKRQTIRAAVRYILNDIETVLVNIAKIDDEFNESMSGLIDSAKALGAQIVAIVEPIINVFGPILSTLLDALTGVADTAAQFVARLTGNDTYVKASKGQSDYASSLDDTTASTKKATKATQEYQNQVLAFDQLNKLDNINVTSDEDDESILGISDADLKKAQTQDSALNDIADDIYKAFTDKDWYQLGKSIANAINDFFDWLDNLVGWDVNKDKFTEWVQDLIDTVNAIIIETDWAQVGRDIGDILNTIIELFGMITDPETGIDFRGLGQGIGELLSNAIQEINWEQLGKDIIQGMQAAVNFVVGILQEDIGYQLGHGFAEAISGIADALDSSVWSDLIVGLFNNFLDFFIEVFSNPDDFATIGAKIGAGIADALNRLDLTKITDAMNNIWVSLTNLVSNFITSFEESYDAEDGQSIWTSLGQGLMEGLQGIMDWLTENILNGETGAQIGTAIGEFFGGLVDSFDPETWAAFFTGIGDMLSELLVNMFGDTQKFYEAGAKLAETLVDMLTDSADEAADEAGDEGSSLGQGIKAVLDALLALLQGFFSDESTLGTITDSISTFFKGIWDFFTGDEWSEEWEKVKKIFNQVLIGLFHLDPDTEDPLGEVEDIIAGWLADFLDDVIDKILPHPFRAIGEAFTSAFGVIGNGIKSAGDWICNLIGIDTRDEMVESVQEGSDDVSENVEKASEKVNNSTSNGFADMANEWVTGSDEVEEAIEESAEETESMQDYASDKILNNRKKHKTEFAESVVTDTDGKTTILGQSQDEIDEAIEENADKEVEALDTAETKTTTSVKEADWCGAEAMSVELQEGCVTVGEDYDNYIDMTEEQSSLLQDALNYAMDSLGNVLGEDWCGSVGMSEALKEGCQAVCDEYGDYIDMNDEQSEALKNSLDVAIACIAKNIDSLVDTNDKVESGFNETEETIDTGAEELKNNEAAMDAVESYFDEFSEQMTESFDEVGEGLSDNWDEVRNSMMENAQDFIDDETVDNAIIDVFNRLNELINSMTSSLTTNLSSSISSINLSITGSHISAIPHMASGGWLDDGQLFYANESGPELIGRYGTGTGVMNNEQIVSAVSEGVRSAVVEAMNSGDSGDIVLYIDSEEIARASTKGNRSIQKRTNPVVSFA